MNRECTVRTPLLRILASVVLVLLAVETAQADQAIYRRALRSTGWVVVPGSKATSSGTCWLADRDKRLAVTCRHVVGDASEVLIYFPSYEKDRPIVEASHYLRDVPAIIGQVIASDAARDLALIRLNEVPAGVEVMQLADRGFGPGDDVHSVGNSGLRGGFTDGTLWWYTRGSIRQVHPKRINTPEGPRQISLVETQAPVNEGDSGGPVVDSQGRLIGVTHSYSEGERLVSQNIDVCEVKAFLKESGALKKAEKALAARPSPKGGWTFNTAGEDEEALEGEGDFREDGTFVLHHAGKPMQGRYTYVNGVLWLIVKDGLASATPTWKGNDHFSLRLGETEMTFTRRSKEDVAEK